MTSSVLFTKLINMLGKEAAQRFLKLAQPELQQSQQVLLDSLQQQDWQMAAALAHKLSATAYLYDSATLQDALTDINAQNLAALQHPAFIPTLTHAFQHIQANIQLFISDSD
jgi:hypothetical protein